MERNKIMVENTKWNGRRFTKTGRWKWVVVLIVVLGVMVAFDLEARKGSSSSPATGSSTAASGLCNDKLTQMESSGAMTTMVAQHQNMLEQMRAALSLQMQQRMDADPMWKSMRSGDFTQMLQNQQSQIDRMLGSAPTCGAP